MNLTNYFGSTNFAHLGMNVHSVNGDTLQQHRYNNFSCFIYLHRVLRCRSYRNLFVTLFPDLVGYICIRLNY